MYYNLFVYSEQQTLRDRLSKSKESLKEYKKVQKGIMAVNFMQNHVKMKLILQIKLILIYINQKLFYA